jgi:hypothetical protein
MKRTLATLLTLATLGGCIKTEAREDIVALPGDTTQYIATASETSDGVRKLTLTSADGSSIYAYDRDDQSNNGFEKISITGQRTAALEALIGIPALSAQFECAKRAAYFKAVPCGAFYASNPGNATGNPHVLIQLHPDSATSLDVERRIAEQYPPLGTSIDLSWAHNQQLRNLINTAPIEAVYAHVMNTGKLVARKH